MSNFIALILVLCNVASWHLSCGNVGSAASMAEIIQTFEDASEATAVLKSLVDGIDEDANGLYLDDLADRATKIAASVSAIGAAFTLAASLLPTGPSTVKDAVVEELQEMGLYFDQLETDLKDAGATAVYKTYYSKFNDDQNLKTLRESFEKFVKNATCDQCKNSFVTSCKRDSMNPQTRLIQIHNRIVKRGNSGSELQKSLLELAGYKWRALKNVFQILVTDITTAAILSQACLGLVTQKSYAEYRKQAKDDGNKIQDVAITLQQTWKVLVQRVREERLVEKEVRKKLAALKNAPNVMLTAELKEFLDQNYPWLLWNVYVYNVPAQSYIHPEKQISSNVYEISDAPNRNVLLTFSNPETYKEKISCLRHMKRTLDTKYSVISCSTINNYNVNNIVPKSETCADSLVVIDMRKDLFSAVTENTVALRICKYYIAMSVI